MKAVCETVKVGAIGRLTVVQDMQSQPNLQNT